MSKEDTGYFYLNLGLPLGRLAFLYCLTKYHRLDGINDKLIFLIIIKVGKPSSKCCRDGF